MNQSLYTWYMYDDTDRYYCTEHLDTSLIVLGLDSWTQVCEKANNFEPTISQFFN